ncbi:MAG: hypothetical protein KO202_05810 [Methanobacteriaceae archaeon]|jgi:hypothetical protein|nr:hypothetical protein [Methanobacteriaceae archaeon]
MEYNKSINMLKNNISGNLTTIIKLGVMLIAPYVGIDEATGNTLVAIIVSILFLILGILDAKYPNTIFTKNNNDTCGYSCNKNEEMDDDTDEGA